MSKGALKGLSVDFSSATLKARGLAQNVQSDKNQRPRNQDYSTQNGYH